MKNKNDYIDLRSDTVTMPTEEMRTAMCSAEVGDDVYGEDPTVNELEEKSAALLGKESALFVSSGTMGNLIAVLTTCNPGDEVIMGHQGHTFLHEGGGISALGGIFPNLIPNEKDGTMPEEALLKAIRGSDIHEPRTKMIILENTHNQCGGIPISLDYSNRIGNLARDQELFLHIDGARIFNASCALKIETSKLVEMADSITFCLSKGLCAPVGSVLCGSQEFITKARRIRKMLGGGMRQAGIVAAAGLISIEKMIDRLPEDHQKAKILADGLKDIPEISFPKGEPQTNMVFLKIETENDSFDSELLRHFKSKGILFAFSDTQEIRLVTHYWISEENIRKVVDEFHRFFQ